MTTQNTDSGAITTTTLRTMRAKLDEAAAIVRAAEGCAMDGQAGRGLMIVLDVGRWPWRRIACFRSWRC